MIKGEEMVQRKILYRWILISFFLLILGFFLGFLLADAEYKKFIYSFKSIRTGGNNDYVYPLLGTDAAEATTIGIYKKTKQEVLSIAGRYQNKGLLEEYGIYVKSIAFPLWFGINDKAEFLPASLYKLPVAMAVYRDIEKGNIKREDKLIYTKVLSSKNKSDELYSPSELVIGKSYSVDELISLMIIQSDNGAKDLLISILHEDTIKETLSLATVDGKLKLTQISPWMYSFYLRILYNATFLSEEDSEKLLSLLSASSYKNALVKGVPDSVKVSHKYGLYNTEDNKFELHDCGIIYTEEDPYIICVMTKGTSIEALEAFIREVSQVVYNYQSVKH